MTIDSLSVFETVCVLVYLKSLSIFIIHTESIWRTAGGGQIDKKALKVGFSPQPVIDEADGVIDGTSVVF